MIPTTSSTDGVETSGGSCRVVSRKDQLSSLHLRLAVSKDRDRSGRFADGFRQETERNIWDLVSRKPVGKQDEHSRQFFSSWTWSRFSQDAKHLAVTVRGYPLVAVIPLLMWLILMAGGLYAAIASSNTETRHRRELAQQIANDKALFLSTELAKVFMPAYVCSVYVRRDPDWTAVNASFEPMAMEMIRLSNAGSILTLSLIPDGVIYRMVPLMGSSPNDDPNWRAIGKDWLQDRFNQDKVLTAINSSQLTIIGPYNLTQGGIGMVAMLSIRIPNSDPNRTFNTPPYVHGALGSWQTPARVQTGPNTTGTPFEPYMYDSATRSKWWGLTTVLISWDILRQNVMRLGDLEALAYSYVLSRPALNKELLLARPDLANSEHELAVAWSANVQQVPPDATNNRVKPDRPGDARPLVYYDLHLRLDQPVVARVNVERAQMTLYLQPIEGWVPAWRNPLIGVVVVVSLLLAVMLFLVLLNRRQHLGLLHAMIPKKVISTLRRGDIFTEAFECVTILFSDIVSYTSMSAQMEPIEVVKMLDELYKEYDNLTEKHKLYKVETIGDAFMVVGGAPDAMDPKDAAKRVAQMALDMVELTRNRVLSGGQNIRIRVGIHSGPIVAAVVGRKMPRYCLFGDTVNTASRMESNGSPMKIHVSATTADLLREAGGFTLESRGDIPIKGKGLMTTFWVTGSSSLTDSTAAQADDDQGSRRGATSSSAILPMVDARVLTFQSSVPPRLPSALAPSTTPRTGSGLLPPASPASLLTTSNSLPMFNSIAMRPSAGQVDCDGEAEGRRVEDLSDTAMPKVPSDQTGSLSPSSHYRKSADANGASPRPTSPEPGGILITKSQDTSTTPRAPRTVRINLGTSPFTSSGEGAPTAGTESPRDGMPDCSRPQSPLAPRRTGSVDFGPNVEVLAPLQRP